MSQQLEPREVQCQACGKLMFAEMPIFRITNQPEFSQILLIHTKVEKCPHCSTESVCCIANAQNINLEFVWAPIKRDSKGSFTSPEPQQTKANVLVRPQTNVKQ